jgi:hypothetical protein
MITRTWGLKGNEIADQWVRNGYKPEQACDIFQTVAKLSVRDGMNGDCKNT